MYDIGNPTRPRNVLSPGRPGPSTPGPQRPKPTAAPHGVYGKNGPPAVPSVIGPSLSYDA